MTIFTLTIFFGSLVAITFMWSFSRLIKIENWVAAGKNKKAIASLVAVSFFTWLLTDYVILTTFGSFGDLASYQKIIVVLLQLPILTLGHWTIFLIKLEM